MKIEVGGKPLAAGPVVNPYYWEATGRAMISNRIPADLMDSEGKIRVEVGDVVYHHKHGYCEVEAVGDAPWLGVSILIRGYWVSRREALLSNNA